MKIVTQVENVIKVDFNAHAISHPASKNFPLEGDPLEQLLAECDIEDYEDEFEEERKLSSEFSKFSMESSVMDLLSSVKERMSYLNDSQKRLKYYLDESYID